MADTGWWIKQEFSLYTLDTDKEGASSYDDTEALPEIPIALRAVQDPGINHGGRTIVICLDGTGDKFDDNNTNIIHLVSCLKKENKFQTTYYRAGIGTYSNAGLITGLMSHARFSCWQSPWSSHPGRNTTFLSTRIEKEIRHLSLLSLSTTTMSRYC